LDNAVIFNDGVFYFKQAERGCSRRVRVQRHSGVTVIVCKFNPQSLGLVQYLLTVRGRRHSAQGLLFGTKVAFTWCFPRRDMILRGTAGSFSPSSTERP